MMKCMRVGPCFIAPPVRSGGGAGRGGARGGEGWGWTVERAFRMVTEGGGVGQGQVYPIAEFGY